MICSNCGTQNEPGTRFCDECGAALSAACPNCGATNRPSAKFCATCGTALAEEGPRPPVRTAAATAERRLVSVLFVDLVGFTPFAEERDPELVRETLDRYFSIARLAIERHGGTIEKFIGDAVMAVWGTPTAHEDDAERAVRAAFELVDAVRSLGPDINARAGIMTGDAAVTIGAEGQGMVAGDLVNSASRLQSVAPAGSVLVDEPTMRASEASITFEAVGAQELKGKSIPVQAYRAERVVANRGGQSRSETLEAPFVGRDEELRELKDLLHSTSRDQRVRLVSVTGPAGIGKSRLTWEFEKYIDGLVEPVLWHRGRSPAYGEGVTFWALGEIVRRRAQLSDIDDETTTRTRIAATTAQYVNDADERAWIEGALLTLLGLEPAPAGGRDALFAAWRIFFERVAATGTTALVFEDLQWADTGLLDFIEHVLEWSKNLPLIVITLSRPELYERRPGWGSGHRLTNALPLEPLSDEHMRELLAGLVPGLPEPAVKKILARADGIPLYAVEIVRMLVADGKLTQHDGAYEPTGELDEFAVPETLRSLIASRLDALEPTDRTLIQEAAVLGQRFTVPALAQVSGMAPEEIEGRLRALVRREFVDVELDPRSPDRGQFGFVQSLIREIAYGTLARPERRSRHLAAARYFESIGDDELAGALATHYLAAYEASSEGPERDAVGAQARLALRGAAERAASLGAHEEAIAYAKQALTVTNNVDERAALLELASQSANLNSDPVAEELARQALELRRQVGDQSPIVLATALLGRVLIDLGRLPDAIEAMEPIEQRPNERDDVPAATVLATLSRAYMRAERYLDSIAAADRALAVAEHENLEAIAAEAFVNKGSSLAALGHRRKSRALLEAGVRLAEAAGATELELRARNNLSVTFFKDDPRRALEIVVEGVEIGRKLGQRSIVNWQSTTAASYAFWIGEDWDAALGWLEIGLTAAPGTHELARASGIAALIGTFRGDDGASLRTAEAAAAGMSEPQVDGVLDWARAAAAFFDGRYAVAHDLAMSAASSWAEFGVSTAPIAARAAAFAGDRARFDAAEAWMRDYPDTAKEPRAARLAIGGLGAFLDGRQAEALSSFRAAADIYRDTGFVVAQAESLYNAIALLPQAAESLAWVDEARSIFERVSAKPWLELLDRAVAARSAAPHAEGATSRASEPAPQRA